jgi:hypothetical protein
MTRWRHFTTIRADSGNQAADHNSRDQILPQIRLGFGRQLKQVEIKDHAKNSGGYSMLRRLLASAAAAAALLVMFAHSTRQMRAWRRISRRRASPAARSFGGALRRPIALCPAAFAAIGRSHLAGTGTSGRGVAIGVPLAYGAYYYGGGDCTMAEGAERWPPAAAIGGTATTPASTATDY